MKIVFPPVPLTKVADESWKIKTKQVLVINKNKNNMVLMDVYKRGVGVIKKFPPVDTIQEACSALEQYCQQNNVQVVAKEKCGDAYWNYLSDGTEFDYCIN